MDSLTTAENKYIKGKTKINSVIKIWKNMSIHDVIISARKIHSKANKTKFTKDLVNNKWWISYMKNNTKQIIKEIELINEPPQMW